MGRWRKGGETRRRSTRLAFEGFDLERRRLLAYVPTVAAYRLNQVAEGGQYSALSATGPDGVTTVVWTDFGLDGDANGVYARRVDASGNPLGGQFRVNTTTAGDQTSPVIGADAQGNVTIVWQDTASPSGGARFFVQRYNAQGAKIGENQLLPSTTGFLHTYAIHVLADGEFVLISNDYLNWGKGHFRRYSAAGEFIAGSDYDLARNDWSFQSIYTTPASALGGGGVVVTWAETRTYTVPDVGTENDGRIWARRLDLNGQPIGEDILLTSMNESADYTSGQSFKPTVAGLADGGFLASWYEYGPGGSAYVGRRYDASGKPQDRLITFSPTSAASYGHGDTVTVIELADGSLLAACVQETAFEADTSDFRIFSAAGDPVTARVPMPAVTSYYLGGLRATPTGGSRFLLTWGDQANPPYNGEIYLAGFANLSTANFAAATASVNESAGSITVTVTRDGSAAAPASVRYSTLSESAAGGSDYTSSSAVLAFAAGQSSAAFTIPILRDTLVEGNETFLVTLGDPVGVTLGNFASLRVTIVDDPSYTGPKPPSLYIDRGAAGLWSWSPGQPAALVNAWDPEGYVVAADGRLFVDFGPHGLWTGVGGDLTLLNAADPEKMLVAPNGTLYVDYGSFGLWRRDATGFALINGANPEGFAAPADGSLYVDFGPFGLWRREPSGGIAQINAANPEGMAAAPDGTLYVDFGPFGFWRRDGRGIVQVNAANPESLAAAADGSVFVDFGAFGLWRWNGGFVQINTANPEALAPAADGSLYIDYGSFGLWRWTAAGFVQLSSGDPEGLTTARDGFIYIDFGPFGVWRRGPSGVLEKIEPTDPQGLAG